LGQLRLWHQKNTIRAVILSSPRTTPAKSAEKRSDHLADEKSGLEGEENDLVVYLAAESADGQLFRQAMPVTLKGRLRELRVQRYYRQLGESQRLRYGLRWYSPVLGLKGHYRTVSRLRAYGPAPDYTEWRARCSPVHRRSLKLLSQQGIVDSFTMVAVLDLRGRKVNMAACDITLNSLKGQLQSHPIPVFLLNGGEGDAAVFSELMALPKKHWVLFTRPGVQFQPWMVAWLGHDATTERCDLMYSDHDVLNANGEREEPYFKPDWSPELAMVTGYIGQAFWVRASLWQSLPEAVQHDNGYGAFMAAARQLKHRYISHVPAILWHAANQADNGYAWPSHEAVLAQMARIGVPGTVETDSHGHWRVKLNVQGDPLVSVIIPTRNLVSMLRPCVESVLHRSTWQNLEVIVVDNQSECPDTLAYLQTLRTTPRVKVLSYNQPFNFSAIMNFAVHAVQGEVVCLLNNDTEVITPDWLEEMVSRLQQPDVGIVGARLLYGDGRVQHMGDVLGAGSCASHLHGPIARDNRGYMSRAVLPQDVSAVTAACMVTSKALYMHLSGFDSANLPVAFNDVDFCLRAQRAGYRVIVTPYAELFHYESVSRGAENSPEKQARARKETSYMMRTWPQIIDRDPFYNPNLNQSRADFHLGRTRNVVAPWEAILPARWPRG
jgi:GT2 family glycosyltransferase